MVYLRELFARTYTNRNQITPEHHRQGFTKTEAANLEYVRSSINKARGVAVGVAGLFFGVMRYKYLSVPGYKRNPLSLVTMFTMTPLIYYSIYYLGAYDRRGSNTYISNFYSNNCAIANRNALMQSLYVFNRKFTPAEIEQFQFSEKLRNRGPKKYHYNPNVHGCECEHKRRHESWNNGEIYINNETKLQIMNQNNEKRMFGEQIHMKPYRPDDHLDHTGAKLGIRYLTFGSRSHFTN